MVTWPLMKLPSPMVAVSNTQVAPCPHRESKYSSFNSLHAVNYSCFLSSTDFFQNQLFRKNCFRNAIRVSNGLDQDQTRHFVGPDLGPNCLQRLSADDTSRQRVKLTLSTLWDLSHMLQ